MNPKLSIAAVSIGLLAGGAGCTSTKQKPGLAVEPPPKTVIYQETVKLTEEHIGDLKKATVPNEGDAAQIMQFALNLSSAGRHLHAAQFLDETANKFSSRNNELAISCYAAAANEFLKAGAMPEFRNAVRRLSQMANRYQVASFDERFLTLLTLGDIASGNTAPTELTPKTIRELYPGYGPTTRSQE